VFPTSGRSVSAARARGDLESLLAACASSAQPPSVFRLASNRGDRSGATALICRAPGPPTVLLDPRSKVLDIGSEGTLAENVSYVKSKVSYCFRLIDARLRSAPRARVGGRERLQASSGSLPSAKHGREQDANEHPRRHGDRFEADLCGDGRARSARGALRPGLRMRPSRTGGGNASGKSRVRGGGDAGTSVNARRRGMARDRRTGCGSDRERLAGERDQSLGGHPHRSLGARAGIAHTPIRGDQALDVGERRAAAAARSTHTCGQNAGMS
jgi:hypothetical protein